MAAGRADVRRRAAVEAAPVPVVWRRWDRSSCTTTLALRGTTCRNRSSRQEALLGGTVERAVSPRLAHLNLTALTRPSGASGAGGAGQRASVHELFLSARSLGPSPAQEPSSKQSEWIVINVCCSTCRRPQRSGGGRPARMGGGGRTNPACRATFNGVSVILNWQCGELPNESLVWQGNGENNNKSGWLVQVVRLQVQSLR